MNIKQINYTLLVVYAVLASSFASDYKTVEEQLFDAYGMEECMDRCRLKFRNVYGFVLPGEATPSLAQKRSLCSNLCWGYHGPKRLPMRVVPEKRVSSADVEDANAYNSQGPVDQYSCEIKCLSDKQGSNFGMKAAKGWCRAKCANQFANY